MVADDMIIAASTKADRDIILEKVMNRMVSLNVKFSKDKLQYMVNEVTYLGHFITAEVVKPDESKVSEILQFPPPTDRKALQCLLGMTCYLSQYIPNKASMHRSGCCKDKDIYIHFTFIHLADAFIQTDLQLLYVRGATPLEQLG